MIPPQMKKVKLESIFHCDDQSALINNLVSSEDPPDGPWSHHSAAQSPLGRASFPSILSIVRGLVCTLDSAGRVVQHHLDAHTWLPWEYVGRGKELSVVRAITRDQWMAEATLKGGSKKRGLLLLELASGGGVTSGIKLKFERIPGGVKFRWGDLYDAFVTIDPRPKRVILSEDRGPVEDWFRGVEGLRFGIDGHLGWVVGAGRSLWLGAEFKGRAVVRLMVLPSGKPQAKPVPVARARKLERDRWETFFREQVPALETDDPVLRDTWYFAWQTIFANRCEPCTPLLSRPFISPARLGYASQWWWDEAFHLGVMRHLRDTSKLYEPLENFFDVQGDDGSIAGSLWFGLTGTRDEMAKASYEGMQMQPPVIGLMLDLCREQPGWPAGEKFRRLYDGLHKWAQWHLSPARDTDQDGLAEYHKWHNTSADQTPRWDSQKVDPAQYTADPMKPTESVDYNVWMALLWRNLGRMAEQLGDADAARAHEAKAVRTMELVEEHTWDDADGFYYDIDGQSHSKIRVKTHYGFMPMLWPEVRKDRCERLVREHLKNPKEFDCRWPLPSVSLDHPAFNPVEMWRGPSWINVNWMVVEGLSRQGFKDEARKLTRKTIDLVGSHYKGKKRTRSPRIWEWYHPHTGAALGNNQYSWTALVVDLILRFGK